MNTFNNKYKIVLDPGHGGNNFGCIYNHIIEKNINLIVAKSCYKYLKKYIDVALTRTNDTQITLKERANYKCDYIISLHFNSAPFPKTPTGCEAWVPNNQDDALAIEILDAIEKNFHINNRGVKRSDDYGLFKHLQSPTIIVEHCFMNNIPSNFNIINNIRNLEKLGKIDAKAILDYIKKIEDIRQ